MNTEHEETQARLVEALKETQTVVGRNPFATYYARTEALRASCTVLTDFLTVAVVTLMRLCKLFWKRELPD